LIYNKTNWISWLSPSSYASRRSWTDGLNFGGTSDWAVDLNETYSNNGIGSAIDSGYDDDDDDDYTACNYTITFDSLDDLSAAAGNLRSDCVAVYTMQVLIDMLDTAYDNYTNVNNGYDDLFGHYVTYIDKLVPQLLEDAFMFNITSDDEDWKNEGLLPELGYGMDCTNSFPSLLSFCLFLEHILNEYPRLHLRIRRHYVSLQPSLRWEL
jgi:chitinase